MNKTIDTIPSGTMEALTQYGWPRNIRELENVIERAVILSPGCILQVPLRDLRSRITPAHGNEKSQTLADVERDHIRSILQAPRCGNASGIEQVYASLPHEEAWNRTSLLMTPTRIGIRNPLAAFG